MLAEKKGEKIAAKQTEIHAQSFDPGTLNIEDIDPRVKEMYRGVEIETLSTSHLAFG